MINMTEDTFKMLLSSDDPNDKAALQDYIASVLADDTKAAVPQYVVKLDGITHLLNWPQDGSRWTCSCGGAEKVKWCYSVNSLIHSFDYTDGAA